MENKKSLSCFIQFIIYFEQFYTIRNFVEIKKQYPCIQQYQSSFEYYRNKGEIPSTLYKKSLKIYRYFHSIEQLILLNEKKPCIHLSINLKKLI